MLCFDIAGVFLLVAVSWVLCAICMEEYCDYTEERGMLEDQSVMLEDRPGKDKPYVISMFTLQSSVSSVVPSSSSLSKIGTRIRATPTLSGKPMRS